MPTIVPFEEHHAPGVRELIGRVFAEYEMTFDLADYDADLMTIDAKYRDAGGAFWVLEADGRVVGTVAIVPLSADEVEIKRVYLDPSLRGRGWGRALMARALTWAQERGYRHVRLWSDVRLTR